MLGKNVILSSQPEYQQPRDDHQQPNEDHHEDCFDLHTLYGAIQFNYTTVQICNYTMDRICYPRTKVLCLQVPETECGLEAGYTCDNHKQMDTLRQDTTTKKDFTVKQCVQDRFEPLKKIQKTPECKNVTREKCDSKWVINNYGQKVFEKNENCREVTWEECKLVENIVEEQKVPVYTCTDLRHETFVQPEVIEEQVTSHWRECETIGGAACTVASREECTTVEWTDCEEVIRPQCDLFTIKTPFQEKIQYHRCHVDKPMSYGHQPQPMPAYPSQSPMPEYPPQHLIPEYPSQPPIQGYPQKPLMPEYPPQPPMPEYSQKHVPEYPLQPPIPGYPQQPVPELENAEATIVYPKQKPGYHQ